VLEFTDESLARLLRAAASVSYGKRRRFIKQFERQLDPKPSTRRMREHRARLANGVSRFVLNLDEVRLEELLRTASLLHGDPDHATVEQALKKFVETAMDEM
jgi:hypothetical protein